MSGIKENTTKTSCTKCESDEYEVRHLFARNSLTGESETIGPFDRFCAYEEKNGRIPPYNTVPRNTRELLYRFFVREEIPLFSEEIHPVTNIIYLFLVLFIPTTIFAAAMNYWYFMEPELFSNIYLLSILVTTIVMYAGMKKYGRFLGFDYEKNSSRLVNLLSVLVLASFGVLPVLMLMFVFSSLSFFNPVTDRKRRKDPISKKIRKDLFIDPPTDNSYLPIILFHLIIVILSPQLFIVGSALLLAILSLGAFGMIFIISLGLFFILISTPYVILYYLVHPIKLTRLIIYWIKFPFRFLYRSFFRDKSIGLSNKENFELFWDPLIIQ